jgi:Zn-dependent alcohol dehydrogenase
VRAAILREPGAGLVVERVELADPGPGELRVRVEAAGVCHTDYHYMQGQMRCPLPAVLGHEGAGIVEAIGPGVDAGIAVGERVAFLWRPRCGQCRYCVAGLPVQCVLGRVQAQGGSLPSGAIRLSAGQETVHHFLGVSCFAEEVVVDARSVVRVPDGVPARIAAIAGCAVVTGLGAVVNVAEHAAGRPLLIIGAGGVGLSAVMGARLVGADPVIVVDLDPAKLELARELGATDVIDGGGDVVAEVLARESEGVPWAIDAVGRPATLQTAFRCLAPTGTLIAVGLAGVDDSVAIPINELVQRQKRVVGALYGAANPLVDLPRIFSLYLGGRLPLDRLLGDELPLERVGEAYERLAQGATGRMVVVP